MGFLQRSDRAGPGQGRGWRAASAIRRKGCEDALETLLRDDAWN